MTPQNAASHLGLFCLLSLFSSKNEIKVKNYIFAFDAPRNKLFLFEAKNHLQARNLSAVGKCQIKLSRIPTEARQIDGP